MIENRIAKLSILALAIFSFGVSAAERVLEDSLVYDDPTVSRPGKWSGGVSLDYFATKNNTTVNDTQGGTHSATLSRLFLQSQMVFRIAIVLNPICPAFKQTK